MAILSENALLAQLSGKLGNIVIKRYKNKTVVTILPEKRIRPNGIRALRKNNMKDIFLPQ